MNMLKELHNPIDDRIIEALKMIGHNPETAISANSLRVLANVLAWQSRKLCIYGMEGELSKYPHNSPERIALENCIETVDQMPL